MYIKLAFSATGQSLVFELSLLRTFLPIMIAVDQLCAPQNCWAPADQIFHDILSLYFLHCCSYDHIRIKLVSELRFQGANSEVSVPSLFICRRRDGVLQVSAFVRTMAGQMSRFYGIEIPAGMSVCD